MLFLRVLFVGILLGAVDCSIGDKLPEFNVCLGECKKDICQGSVGTHYKQLSVLEGIFGWTCETNCDYQCQQIVTDVRESQNLPIVQFYGKWPFLRVFGIQELFSTIFSIANLMVNYNCFQLVGREYTRNRVSDYSSMYFGYLVLCGVSIVGWMLSTLFHTKDTPLFEVLDYFGAAAMIMTQFYVIFIRYFNLFKPIYRNYAKMIAIGLTVVYWLHVRKLLNNWDYQYNIRFNIVFGLSSTVLWVLHSNAVNNKTLKNSAYTTSIQLLPYETVMLRKLNSFPVISRLSSTKFLPLLPIFFNGWLLTGMSFELFDFVWFRLIDAHCLWHFMTIFPPYIWYNWNLWDLELLKASERS